MEGLPALLLEVVPKWTHFGWRSGEVHDRFMHFPEELKEVDEKIVDCSDLGPDLDHEVGEKIVDLSLYCKFLSSKQWLKDSPTALNSYCVGSSS